MIMGSLSQVLGDQVSAGLDQLISQFDQGQHQQVDDQELQQAYGQVAGQLPQDQYVQAAKDAFARLSPEQRAEFARQLQAQAAQHGLPVPAAQAATTDPSDLAAATGQVHAIQPNLLQQMFAPGGTFSSPIAKAALLGITAMAAQRLMGSKR
jgi:hypothetical protein